MKLCITAIFLLSPFYSLSQNAKEIVQKADAKMRALDEAEMIIKTIRPSWTREMQCKK